MKFRCVEQAGSTWSVQQEDCRCSFSRAHTADAYPLMPVHVHGCLSVRVGPFCRACTIWREMPSTHRMVS